MANGRDVALSITIHAVDSVSAYRQAKRIVKKAHIRKVHAYQVLQRHNPQSSASVFTVDVILKESIVHTRQHNRRVHNWAMSVSVSAFEGKG